VLFFVIHVFRMALFFVIAGFFARVLFERQGLGGFVRNRARRVGLVLLAFYVPVLALTFAPIIWAAMQSGMKGPPPGQENPMAGGIPWVHLWFLYLLLVLYGLLLLLRVGVLKFDAQARWRDAVSRALRWLFDTRLAPLALALPVFATLMTFDKWIAWMGIPAPITGFVPNLASVVCFGGALLTGWFMHRDRELLARVARDASTYLLLGVALTVVALALIGTRPQFLYVELALERKLAYAATYSIALWCWVFGLIGMVERLCTGPSARWRYLADASYWMYLIHVPIVWGLAAWMMRWPQSWMLKFPLILAIAAVVLLASYHYLVRPSFLGQFLNGRKYPRAAQLVPAQTKNLA
jgi:glucans biosynthesis protein C